MKALTTLISQQSDFQAELSDHRSTYDVIEKAIDASGVDDLLSVLDVLIGNNEWFRRFLKVETEYLAELQDTTKQAVLRTDEDTSDRLSELNAIYSHYEVCLDVVNHFKTKKLEAIAEVFSGAVAHLGCLQYEQKSMLKKIKKEAA